MNLNDAQPYLHALGDVLWGDLWLTPRGFAYLALGMALAYAVAMWRARRVCARTVANSRVHYYTLSGTDLQASQLQEERDKLLLLVPIEKLRTILLWLAMVFTMLAVQSYVLAIAEPARVNDYLMRNDILFYSPLSTNVPYYYELVNAFGSLAFVLAAMRVCADWIGDEYSPPYRIRLIDWIAGLVDPIGPDSPPNAIQRTLARLRPSCLP